MDSFGKWGGGMAPLPPPGSAATGYVSAKNWQNRTMSDKNITKIERVIFLRHSAYSGCFGSLICLNTYCVTTPVQTTQAGLVSVYKNLIRMGTIASNGGCAVVHYFSAVC